jgi:formate hydrogenlyase transcriptional activator
MSSLPPADGGFGARARTLLEINNAIVSSLTQETLFDAIARALRPVISFDRTAIFLHDPERDVLQLFVLQSSLESRYFDVGLELQPDESHVGWVFRNQRPLLRRDLATERQYPAEELAYADGVRAYVIVPLVAHGTPLGTLAVASTTPRRYDEADAAFLQEIAGQVALAVRNMRAYRDVSVLHGRVSALAARARTLLEVNNALISNLTREALFSAIARAIRSILPFDRCALFLHDPGKDVLRLELLEPEEPWAHFTVGMELQLDTSLVGWVFRHHQVRIRGDLASEREYPAEDLAVADGVRSVIVAPLLVRGRATGALVVASGAVGRYTEEDARLLQEVATQVALVAENMKAYQEIASLSETVSRAEARQRTLLEINNAVVARLEKDALFSAIALAVRRIVATDRTAVFLHDPARGMLRLFVLASQLGTEHFVVGWEQTSGEDSPAGRAFRQGRPLVRRDLAVERVYRADDLSYADGIRSYVIVPLVARGTPLGVLTVASRTPDRYADADVDFLQEVAKQVALAIANMQAYEEIATLKRRLEAENVYLQEEIHQEHNFTEMVGNHPALLAVLRQVEQVARSDATVLIGGETGAGKELVARALHDRSHRRERPLVKVNCGAISAGLVESELFGHVKGAFTGAIDRRVGRFELADGGTLFLDEVGELPLDTQVKLLRVLQEREFEPVGSSQTRQVDVRIIAATARDLEVQVAAGRFRADLYYRLNVVPLRIPALRDRPSDIPQLVMFFVDRFARKLGKRMEAVSQETMARLTAYPWPGNVRELQNVIERAVVLSPGTVLVIDAPSLGAPAPGSTAEPGATPVGTEGAPPGPSAGVTPKAAAAGASPGAPPPRLQDVERRHIEAVLAKTAGRIEGLQGAARLLGLHPNTLRSRMKKLGVRRPGTRGPT